VALFGRIHRQPVETVVGPFLDQVDQLVDGRVITSPVIQGADPGTHGSQMGCGLIGSRCSDQVAQDLDLLSEVGARQRPARRLDQHAWRHGHSGRRHREQPADPGRDRAGQHERPGDGGEQEGGSPQKVRPPSRVTAPEVSTEPHEQAGGPCQAGQGGRPLQQRQDHRRFTVRHGSIPSMPLTPLVAPIAAGPRERS
jgi:hypothetical protein